jgi:hypothetical protein
VLVAVAAVQFIMGVLGRFIPLKFLYPVVAMSWVFKLEGTRFLMDVQ